MKKILYIGHFNWDNTYWQGNAHALNIPGGALLYGAMAACSAINPKETEIEIITKIAKNDISALKTLTNQPYVKDNLILVPASHKFHVNHPNKGDMKTRDITQLVNPGPYTKDDMPEGFSSDYANIICLAGNTNQEFSYEFIKYLADTGYKSQIAIDMQCLIRQVVEEGKVENLDVEKKREIVGLAKIIKTDDEEAEILTGEKEMKKAGRIMKSWGCEEVIITSSDDNCIYVADENNIYRAKFTKLIKGDYPNRSGRGDASKAIYTAKRLEGYSIKEALEFTAASVSIRMEMEPGTNRIISLDDICERIAITEVICLN